MLDWNTEFGTQQDVLLLKYMFDFKEQIQIA